MAFSVQSVCSVCLQWYSKQHSFRTWNMRETTSRFRDDKKQQQTGNSKQLLSTQLMMSLSNPNVVEVVEVVLFKCVHCVFSAAAAGANCQCFTAPKAEKAERFFQAPELVVHVDLLCVGVERREVQEPIKTCAWLRKTM